MFEKVKERKVGWIELFYDLIFVVGVSSSTQWLHEIEHINSENNLIFFKYLLMVIPMLWAWTGQTMFYNRFGENQTFVKPLMLIQLFFVALMISSFNLNFDETYYTFILGYIGIRTITIIQYALTYYKTTDYQNRRVIFILTRGMLISIIISAISLFFTGQLRYTILYIGIFLDIILPLLLVQFLKV